MIFRKNHDGSAKLVLDLHSGLSRRPCPISIGQTRYRSCWVGPALFCSAPTCYGQCAT